MALAPRVVSALRAGGLLAARWPGFEERHAQVEMARDVAAALERGGTLMAEAPTGVGKSVAYLLPAVLHAHEQERRVVVATCTRSLQDQLFERDLPALLDALGVSLPVARLKGKQNYLCPRALELADPAEGEEETLEALRAWAAEDPAGDLDRFDPPDAEAYRRLRPRVATDPSACNGATCRRGRECFWARARRAAGEARLTVVNHALLARAAEAEGLLPEYDVLIIDEAHRLEGVLSSQLERGVSRHRFDELLRLTGSARTGRRRGADAAGGLLARARGVALPLLAGAEARDRLVEDLERLGGRADAVRSDVERLFARFTDAQDGARGPYGVRRRYRNQRELLGRELDELEVVLEHGRTYATTLRRCAGAVIAAGTGRSGEDIAGELEMVAARWDRLGADLTELCDATDPDWVYWRTQSPNARAAELRGAPVSVGAYARDTLLARARTSVLTSATLSSAGDFSWAAERLGLSSDAGVACETASYESPFPLREQMRVHVLDGGPDEAATVAAVVAELASRTTRNALVLFTAHERLRRARTRLAGLLPPERLLLAQDVDGTTGVLVDRFRAARGAVLLGVASLWEGVDFPGETLELLVVAKLPFSVPDEPLVEARAERLRERGLDAFRADALPEAVVRFRQGVGRLIRRSDDRGVLVVCDPRLASASYRSPFLAALPVQPQLWRDARGLAEAAARFLDESPVRERQDA
jgi:DNA polymerase-3 subunit epsilon/ATP-dependent DNA helicase DinG